MSDFEEKLRSAPSLAPRAEHHEATLHEAMRAFHKQQRRSPIIVPFLAAFLGAAACLTIAVILLQFERQAPYPISRDELSREMIVQAFVELRETFPEGLAAVAFINGEMQVYPGVIDSEAVEPAYIEMKIGSKTVKVVASQGMALPLVVDGKAMTIEFMSDLSGQPTVLGDDFFWSSKAQYMSIGREVLEAESLNLFL